MDSLAQARSLNQNTFAARWSSTENNANNAWNFNFNNGNTNNNNKNNTNYVRAVRASSTKTDTSGCKPRGFYMQLNLFQNQNLAGDFDVSIEEVFEAYLLCRRNKRKTMNALAFESDYECRLLALYEELKSGAYQPGRSIAFVVDKPVKREIFAADFKDRVVHHLLINKLNPLFEKTFIEDSYACRPGKGTHYGIQRIFEFIKSCSDGYRTDCYILKLDIQGFFMHIDRSVLFNRLRFFIQEQVVKEQADFLVDLSRKIIYNDPTKNCYIKGMRSNWVGLPTSKSLFHSPFNCGLPIGNLTSQVFANFYMHAFDVFVKQELGIACYGRYVDDFVLVHEDKNFLKSLIPVINNFLRKKLKLTLHPNKIYCQHYSKGVTFLGTVLKPNRIYIARRTKGNFYSRITHFNKQIQQGPVDKNYMRLFQSTVNSYLGILKHYNTYRLRKKMVIIGFSAWWWNHFSVAGGYQKIVFRYRVVK